MSCEQCSTGEKLVLHIRILQIPGLFRQIQTEYNANPYWEYEKHPIVSRELTMAKEMLKNELPQIPIEKFKEEVVYHVNQNDDTHIRLYLELK